MNHVILIGRLTRDAETRYNGEMAISKYTLAVDRKYKREGEPTADFINCTAFGKNGEFAEKYLKKGTKILVQGRIQTGSYEKDGHKVYTADVIVDSHEFVESKNAEQPASNDNGFMPLPDDFKDEELPFA